MKDNFKNCAYIVRGIEGGYVNDPKDPGGATKYGVTKLTLQDYRKRPVSIGDVRDLTTNEANDIYKDLYWDAIKGDILLSGVDLCVFDAAIHSGPAQAVKWLQRCIGASEDGIIGKETIAFQSHCLPSWTIEQYCDIRLISMQSMKAWEHSKNGWMNRIETILKKSLKLAHP